MKLKTTYPRDRSFLCYKYLFFLVWILTLINIDIPEESNSAFLMVQLQLFSKMRNS